MAVVAATRPNLAKRLVTFYHDVVAEMKKVTWPDRPQATQLSIGVIGLSLFIGFVIWLLDIILQYLLVNLIPSIFR